MAFVLFTCFVTAAQHCCMHIYSKSDKDDVSRDEVRRMLRDVL